MTKARRATIAVITALCMLMSLFAVLTGGGITAYAESPVSSSDGTYSVPVNLDGLTMGADSFSSAATVEKSGKNYYMTFGHSSSVDDLVLERGNMETVTPCGRRTAGRITPIPWSADVCKAVFPSRHISYL